MPELPPQFKPPFTHQCGIIFAETLKNDQAIALDVRGWGYLTGSGSGALGLSDSEADLILDQFGDWVTASLNKAAAQQET